jgi:hypothetical protein
MIGTAVEKKIAVAVECRDNDAFGTVTGTSYQVYFVCSAYSGLCACTTGGFAFRICGSRYCGSAGKFVFVVSYQNQSCRNCPAWTWAKTNAFIRELAPSGAVTDRHLL